MAVPTLFASRLATIMGRRGAKKLVAGTRAVCGASAAVCGASAAAVHGARAHSTAASHEAPFCLASPPPADPEALRSRWREQCLAIATGGAADVPAPPRDSHELGGYFS